MCLNTECNYIFNGIIGPNVCIKCGHRYLDWLTYSGRKQLTNELVFRKE